MKLTQDLFAYPFRDDEWVKKAAIYGLISLLGVFIIPLPLIGGYGLRLLRGVIKTGELSLPEWEDLGDMYLDGLAQMVISLVYSLPVYILLCCGMIPLFGAPVAMTVIEDAPGLAVGSMIAGYGIGMLLLGLASLLGLLVSFVLYAGIARYADTGDLGSAFRFGEVWRLIKANFGQFLLVFAVYYGITMGLSFVTQILMYTVVLICLLPFLMVLIAFYMQALVGAMYGLAYREAQQKLTASLDAAPEPAE